MSVIKVTSDNFRQVVLEAEQPVLVDFWASWCGPCRMLSPVVDEIGEQAKGFTVCKVNVDEQPELAEKYGIMSIPTLIVMKNGSPAERSTGVVSKSRILSMLS